MAETTVKEIMESWLKENKYDGLYVSYPHHCECGVDDLTCRCGDHGMESCRPGFKVLCQCPDHGGVDHFHIMPVQEDDQ